MQHYVLVMAGGQGTRLWPVSTKNRPKQYLPLISGNSLLKESLERLDGFVRPQHRFVVATRDQESLARKHTSNSINEEGLILEPSSKNTAPCLLFSLAYLAYKKVNPRDVIAVLPADHGILKTNVFQETLAKAFSYAGRGHLMTIGIPPTSPHTGYGYIHKGRQLEDDFFCVKEFVEKPDLPKAEEYYQSGNFFWNSGIAVASFETFLREFEQYAPSLFIFFERFKKNCLNNKAMNDLYQEIPSESFDYAVMEKSSNVFVIPGEFGWSDLGSWEALAPFLSEEQGNALYVQSSFVHGSKGNIVYAPNKTVFLEGVDDMLVISNGDAIVLLPKKKSQNIKEMVANLKDQACFEDFL